MNSHRDCACLIRARRSGSTGPRSHRKLAVAIRLVGGGGPVAVVTYCLTLVFVKRMGEPGVLIPETLVTTWPPDQETEAAITAIPIPAPQDALVGD